MPVLFARFSLVFVTSVIFAVVASIVVYRVLDAQYKKERAKREAHMNEQKAALDTAIGDVKTSVGGVAARIGAILAILATKNDQTPDIDLAPELVDLGNIKTTLDALAQLPATPPIEVTPPVETTPPAASVETAPDATASTDTTAADG